MRFYIFLILSFISIESRAGLFRSRNEAQIGLTDNANLESSNRDADIFERVATTNAWTFNPTTLGFRFGYTNFNSQDINDNLAWRIFAQGPLDTRTKWNYYTFVFGQHYVNGNPGTTDSAFDNFGAEFDAEKLITPTASLELLLVPGLRWQKYSDFDDRSDTTFFGSADFSYFRRHNLDFGARGEIGIIFSSLPDYRRNYFEVGGHSHYTFRPLWSLNSDLTLRLTSFSSRTISESTLTARKRGFVTARTGIEYEGLSWIGFDNKIRYEWTPDIKLESGLLLSSQSSRSGTQDYSAVELNIGANFIF